VYSLDPNTLETTASTAIGGRVSASGPAPDGSYATAAHDDYNNSEACFRIARVSAAGEMWSISASEIEAAVPGTGCRATDVALGSDGAAVVLAQTSEGLFALRTTPMGAIDSVASIGSPTWAAVTADGSGLVAVASSENVPCTDPWGSETQCDRVKVASFGAEGFSVVQTLGGTYDNSVGLAGEPVVVDGGVAIALFGGDRAGAKSDYSVAHIEAPFKRQAWHDPA
jgi:hypothetical protein